MVVTGSLQASYRGALRIYGFEGEAGREGEGATRTTESSYRRAVSPHNSRARIHESCTNECTLVGHLTILA